MKTQQDVSVSRLLSEDLILVRPPCRDADQLLEALVGKVCSVKFLGNPQDILRKILKREHEGIDTTLDTGLSLPHIYLQGFSETVAALGILPQGVADPKNPKLAIRAMLLLISADVPRAYKQHLKLLRDVARLFQPTLIDRLARAATSVQALNLIRQCEIRRDDRAN